jgi:thiamine pyrophosphate-dependent acetolactate synthase large subunit-like protein
MNQKELCRILLRYAGDAAIVLSAGNASFELFGLAPVPPGPVLYQMELGYASAVALGVALGDPGHRAVAVEGDGSMTAALATLSTIARYGPANFIAVVTDNESYAAIQDAAYPPFPTVTRDYTDFEGVARSCGIRQACTVREPGEAEEALAKAFSTPGPWFIVAKLEPSLTTVLEPDDPRDRDEHHLPDVFDNALAFTRAVRNRTAR